MSAPIATPIKYSHSKVKPVTAKQQRKLDRRTVAKQSTIERMYGHFYPLFGGALGASYNKLTGAIDSTDRAASVA